MCSILPKSIVITLLTIFNHRLFWNGHITDSCVIVQCGSAKRLFCRVNSLEDQTEGGHTNNIPSNYQQYSRWDKLCALQHGDGSSEQERVEPYQYTLSNIHDGRQQCPCRDRQLVITAE